MCASMMFGMLSVGAGFGHASPDNAIFKGNVKIDTDPAPDTLVMYSVGAQEAPSGNSTVSDLAGDYEMWVDGGRTYYLYFANGAAMFDFNAQIQSAILPGQTKFVNATLNPAPARTVTMKGFLTNSSDSQPVTAGHLLGFESPTGQDPEYINWTTPDANGYYEVTVIPGPVMAAIFDAPGYFPMRAPSVPILAVPGDTVWINMSLRPFTGYTVNVTGYVMDSVLPMAIQGAQVRVTLEGVGYATSNFTDASGFYKVQTVDGDGTLDVTAAGYMGQRMESLHFSGNMSFDFYLQKENAVIHGFVLDAETGEPIPNATVWAESGLGPSFYQYNQSTSAEDGSYSLGLCGSNWWVSADALGYGGRGETVELLAGEDLLHNITMDRESGSIRGVVTDWATGLPIEGAAVRIAGDMTGRENMAFTNASGYYEIRCLPDSYELTFIAADYMWEVSMEPDTVVGPSEMVWVNHTLDPATVQLFGTVTDAITHGSINGASVTVGSLSAHNPDYFRIMIGASVAGNYSMMVAFDDGWSVVMAEHPSYQDSSDMISIPDVPSVEHNISMLPILVDNYTLQGFVNDTSTDNPIEMAILEALFGQTLVNLASSNDTGFYTFNLAVVDLNIKVWAAGYLPTEALVAPGAAGEIVWMNFTLDSHLEPPILAESISPNASVSLHNHANVSADISEPYLLMVSLNLTRIVERTEFYVWAQDLEAYNGQVTFGSLFGDLDGDEIAPGQWWVALADWDTTSQDLVMLTDDTGSWEMSDSYWMGPSGDMFVWGNYENATMMWPMFGNAMFDPAGAFLGVDMGGGLEPGTATDPTGRFWMMASFTQFNLTDGTLMNRVARDTTHFVAPDLRIDGPGITYPSSEYAAIYAAVDAALNWNYTFELLTVDNDPPVADAGPFQTEIVGLAVTLDASGSTDNGVLVNYTWSVEDGVTRTLWGESVDYTFTTVGNHTVTVTVRDAAGYSGSASAQVEIIADQLPAAAAGPDQVVDEDTIVVFDGTGSHDDVGIVNYTWMVVGATTTLFGLTPTHIFSIPGIYHVRLVVRDTAGQSSAFDEVVIAVLDVTAPVANAGADQTVNVGTVATLDGSGSSDNAGVTQYTWTFTDGTLRTLTGVNPTYTFATGADYTVTLTARDAEGNSDTDTVLIHVNVAPQAHAGADQEVEEGSEVSFSGSASTDDYGIRNYTWTFTYEGTARTLYGVSPKFTFDVAGTYEVRLTVKDVGGLTSTDTQTVTVTGGGAASFVTDYWWALLLVVVVVVIVVVALLMRKGKGPSPKAAHEPTEAPPPPTDAEELEFPPPNDEEL